MNRAVKFIKDCGVFYLATVDGDYPHVRPFGAITEYDGKIYITTGNKKNVYRQMIVNPNIEISATAEDGSWIRLTGRATVEVNEGAKAAVMADYEGIKDIYKGREEEFSILSLYDVTAIIYSGEDEEVIEM